MNTHARPTARRSRGRPRKFDEPSRSVTLTLPQDVLDRLEMLDGDRAKAIVRAAEIAAPPTERAHAQVEVIRVGPGVGLMTVPDCPSLRAAPNVSLVQIAADRNLIVLAPGTPLSEVEIAISDLLETVAPANPDRAILESLLEKMRILRRTQSADTGDVILVRMT